jgi:hypothetical protein
MLVIPVSPNRDPAVAMGGDYAGVRPPTYYNKMICGFHEIRKSLMSNDLKLGCLPTLKLRQVFVRRSHNAGGGAEF